ncbi:hypothetical protein D7Z54_19305 [Salibacterium salarium]|uniref:Uncharacterized protein n=1 Tax=Salibacterium salarium TaxID=284579 RepID=A0A428N038_9BACI|nr:hypothetical protein [Salibacterium salarium]RSL31775.1 hypothetical protein D7Z54_19305 [Salibacterium salarium]
MGGPCHSWDIFLYSFFFGEQSWIDYYLLAVFILMIIIAIATYIKRDQERKKQAAETEPDIHK